MTLYLSRLTLRRDPDVAALRQLIDPDARARAADAHHRLIWSLFADTPDRRRDFLWRAEARGRFYVLSARPPAANGLFEAPEVKPFAPSLSCGDRLAFALRANATESVPADPADLAPSGQPRRRKRDVVMARLHDLPGRAGLPEAAPSARAPARMRLAQEAAVAWIESQGCRHGFRPSAVEVADYAVLALPGYRGPRRRQPQFGVLDLNGALDVTDPAAFLAQLSAGFGRAKAFGCGLMLIRRA